MIMKYRNDGASFCLSLFHALFLENLCRDKVFKQKYQTVCSLLEVWTFSVVYILVFSVMHMERGRW